MKDEATIMRELAAPFPDDEVQWKPQKFLGRDSVIAVCYIDARAVMDRLDAVVGSAGWYSRIAFGPKESVLCELSVKIGDVWVTKQDVGEPQKPAKTKARTADGEVLSEEPEAAWQDGGQKAAASDALKRVAVHFGVFRYGYAIPTQILRYDRSRMMFIDKPVIPDKFRYIDPHAAQSQAELYDRLQSAVDSAATLEELKAAWSECGKHAAILGKDNIARLTQAKDRRKEDLTPRGSTASASSNAYFDHMRQTLADAPTLEALKDAWLACIADGSGFNTVETDALRAVKDERKALFTTRT